MTQPSTDTENQNLHRQLSASFALSGYLLEAHSEEAAILAAMKVSTELLGAHGSAFIPFNEWKQSLPALKYGQADFLLNVDWQARLSAPATRYACRSCGRKQAGPECVLLHDVPSPHSVFCVNLRCGGREIGVLSYFFNNVMQIGEKQHLFLAEMVRLTDLALDHLRLHARQMEATQ